MMQEEKTNDHPEEFRQAFQDLFGHEPNSADPTEDILAALGHSMFAIYGQVTALMTKCEQLEARLQAVETAVHND